MRLAIHDLLVAGVPEVQGRVVEPYAASKDDTMPFLVYGKQTPDAKPSDYAGPITRIEVWPVVARTSFVTTDQLAAAIKTALHEARFSQDGHQYYAEHVSTGADTLDNVFDAYTRQVVFEVADLNWLLGTTFDPDPIAALRTWTESAWPTGQPLGDVQTDPLSWQPSAANPGIYWRFAGNSRIVEQWPTWTLYEARIMGHVLSPSPDKRLEWTRRVTEALAAQRRVRLSDDSPLTIMRIASDSSAHQIRQGQITVFAQYGVLIPQPDNPLNNVVFN